MAIKGNVVHKPVLNVVPDPIDPRDQTGIGSGVLASTSLPKSKDYSAETLPVDSQGQTGSCVGWATSYYRAWLHRRDTGQSKRFSQRFIWIAAKEIDPWPLNVMFDGAGTKIRDAFKIMNKHGAAPLTLWPFDKRLPDPSKEKTLIKQAEKYRIGAYYSLGTNEERRAQLAKRGPFVIGVPVFSNWSQVGSDGVIPEPGGFQRGGHALLVVGYDDKTGYFKVQNSWGTGWGKSGYGFISYKYMEEYCWSAWAAQ